MTEKELGQALKFMYDNAQKGEKVSAIHVFGIKYSLVITDNKYSIKNIVYFSGISESFSTEVSKGVKLSKYVNLKD